MTKFITSLKMYLRKMMQWRVAAMLTFFVLGIASTVWFLIRVIPKPSRAAYPCMRASAPFMSAFVLYLLSITSTVVVFRKFRQRLLKFNYIAALGFLIVAVISIFISGSVNNTHSSAAQLVDENYFTPNDPIGTARGINPGRVVWVWNNDATDATCTNTNNDYWFQNTNAAEVDSMLAHGIVNLAGESTLQASWDAIFRYFNSNHGNGDVGYTSGEKIYIKINLTNSCCSVSGTARYTQFERMDATPELALALLRHLIEVVGVAESDIYLGDPFRIFYDLYWNTCHTVYPDVHYCDKQGINGRQQTIPTSSELLKFSDGVFDVRIPQEYVDATYFINMPCLKTHDSGGITLTAKNHQGSMLQDGANADEQSAFDMHYALPDHDATDGGHHRYRHLVDYMGHEQLGGKTLLAIVDGIWAGRSWEGFVEKWQMAPFNNDYPSSLFLSQDEVAIQSVCYDFLLEEYKDKPSGERYPYMEGTDDFLYQAADATYWPAGVQYDPEGDGTIIGSLGVFEHWNDASSKQYSRNLGSGSGIELITDTMGSNVVPPIGIKTEGLTPEFMLKSYPNPATEQVFFDYSIDSPGKILAEIYALNGSKIAQLKNEYDFTGSYQLTYMVNTFPAGIYLFRLEVQTARGTSLAFKKFRVE
jgi:hypothetical protein